MNRRTLTLNGETYEIHFCRLERHTAAWQMMEIRKESSREILSILNYGKTHLLGTSSSVKAGGALQVTLGQTSFIHNKHDKKLNESNKGYLPVSCIQMINPNAISEYLNEVMQGNWRKGSDAIARSFIETFLSDHSIESGVVTPKPQTKEQLCQRDKDFEEFFRELGLQE